VAKLPVFSGRNLIQLLKKRGFRVIRQKGSHVSMRKGNHKTVVPLHDELAKGTLLGPQYGSSWERIRGVE